MLTQDCTCEARRQASAAPIARGHTRRGKLSNAKGAGGMCLLQRFCAMLPLPPPGPGFDAMDAVRAGGDCAAEAARGCAGAFWLRGQRRAHQQPRMHGEQLQPCHCNAEAVTRHTWQRGVGSAPDTYEQALPVCILVLRLGLAGVQIGFFALLAVEFAAHRGLLELVGIRTGSGLGFEF